jgi:hypothetical protein
MNERLDTIMRHRTIESPAARRRLGGPLHFCRISRYELDWSSPVNVVAMQSILERLGHNFDPHRVFAAVRLCRCRGCGRIWRFKPATNSVDSLTYTWLRLVEPTGWTMTIDLPFAPALDEVFPLSPIEMLLWNAEPCPGPPTRDYPGAIENAAYRLIALGVLDAISAKTAMEGIN